MHVHVFSFLMFICSFIGVSMFVCSSIIGGALIFMFIYNFIDGFFSFLVLLYNSIVISLVLSLVLIVANVFFGFFVSFHSLCVCMCFFS
jgi:hypothetical protein